MITSKYVDEDSANCAVYVNGVQIGGEFSMATVGDADRIGGWFEDRGSWDVLMAEKIDSINRHFWHIVLHKHIDTNLYYLSSSIYLDRDDPDSQFVEITLNFKVEDWTRSYSTKELSEIIETILASKIDIWGKVINSDTEIRVSYSELIEPVPDFIDQEIDNIQLIVESSIRKISEDKMDGSLSRMFIFPDSISVACEQYLVYFSQFLIDLGIEAEVSVRHQATETLFNVIPKDGEEALERIREALDVYLQLPSEPGFDSATSGAGGIAVFQLRANVMHLQSQIELGKAMLEQKDATIEALRLTNFVLRSQFEVHGPQAVKQLEGSVDPDKDRESLVGPYVSVKPVDKGGVVFNLPEILRGLKRFRKKE